jgi:hypothetical protein
MQARAAVVQQPEQRQRSPHVGQVVERLLAGALAGNAGAGEGFEQRLALRAEAVEHGEVAEGTRRRGVVVDAARVEGEVARAAHHLLDLVDDILRLGFVGRRAVDVHLDGGDEVRPDAQRGPVRAAGDHLLRGGQDQLAGAVVAAQAHFGRVRVVAAEAQEIAAVGAAEAVDRLVRVADHADVGRPRTLAGEQPQQAILSQVDILVLVHGDPAVARGEAGAQVKIASPATGRRGRPGRRSRAHWQPQRRFVSGVDLRQAWVGVGQIGQRGRVRRQELVLRRGDEAQQGVHAALAGKAGAAWRRSRRRSSSSRITKSGGKPAAAACSRSSAAPKA